MGDFVIKNNDMIKFTVPPPAVVPQIAAPVPLVGTGTTVTIGGLAVCLQGDELPPAIRTPLTYTAPPYSTPGTGTLTIMLQPTNLSQKSVQGKPMLLKGSVFQATFTVSAPAMQPTPSGPVPDPLMSKTFTCEFVTTNTDVQAG